MTNEELAAIKARHEAANHAWDRNVQQNGLRAHSDRAALIQALKSQPQPSQGWQKITDDIKDGRRVLLKFKSDLGSFGSTKDRKEELARWNDLEFVGHNILGKDGYDYNWNFAAPVGMGGFPDEWLVGYMPLPSPPAIDKVTT